MHGPRSIASARAVRLATAAAGGLGLLLWCVPWIRSFAQLRWSGPPLWFDPWKFLGLDFAFSYRAGALVLRGGDPYTQPFGDSRGLYAYPPLTLGLHLWAPALPFRAALALHSVLSVGIFAGAVAWANRIRASVGASRAPYLPALLAVLVSTPVLFTLERGQCDQLMLPLLFVAAWALGRTGPGPDAVAGAAIGAAVGMKVYPVFAVPALLFLRRFRAAALAAAATVLLALLPHTGDFIRNLKGTQHHHGEEVVGALDWLAHPRFAPSPSQLPAAPYAHSLTTNWTVFFGRTPFGSVPGLLGAGALLLGPALWVSLAVAKAAAPARSAAAAPYLLWITAWATFLLPSSFDYNLVFLVLAALALWDRGDGLAVHLLLGSFLVSWQPLALPFTGECLLVFKLMGLLGAGASLVAKVRRPPLSAPA